MELNYSTELNIIIRYKKSRTSKTSPFWAFIVCSSICLKRSINSSFSRSILSFSFSAISLFFFSFSNCALKKKKNSKRVFLTSNGLNSTLRMLVASVNSGSREARNSKCFKFSLQCKNHQVCFKMYRKTNLWTELIRNLGYCPTR